MVKKEQNHKMNKFAYSTQILGSRRAIIMYVSLAMETWGPEVRQLIKELSARLENVTRELAVISVKGLT